jgi:hypothetical protein
VAELRPAEKKIKKRFSLKSAFEKRFTKKNKQSFDQFFGFPFVLTGKSILKWKLVVDIILQDTVPLVQRPWSMKLYLAVRRMAL